jgi:threonine synthase
MDNNNKSGKVMALFLSTAVGLLLYVRSKRQIAGGVKTLAATTKGGNSKTLYTSTRGVQEKTFEEAVLLGLASDGGLFCPVSVPSVPKDTINNYWSRLSYPALALEVFKLFVPSDACDEKSLEALVRKTYGPKFRSDDVTPTVRLEKTGVELLELFHGPTFAFKDVALQFLGNLFEHLLSRKKGDDAKITVLGATSGDTGSSAIYGLAGKKGIECFILFPEGRVSPIQERQMTTVQDKNVHCIAIHGTFDDAQDIVKASFKDEPFRAKYRLAAVNSINWARILAQITYYFYSYFQVIKRTKKSKVVFVVPTGNFGDILAGYYAKRMGLPVHKFVVATNENDILDRFFKSGTYERREVSPTITPSMDICVSSNFERFIFHMLGDDSTLTNKLMKSFESDKTFTLPAAAFERCKKEMCSAMVTEDGIRKAIKKTAEVDGYMLDPHTAVGVAAADALKSHPEFADCEIICVATAHWGKFVDAVEGAVGKKLSKQWVQTKFPKELEALKTLPVRKTVLGASAAEVKQFMEKELK